MMCALPPLHGLVLAGGRSRRFGRDKAAFRAGAEAQPLALRAAALLAPRCERVRLSARPGQTFAFELPPELVRVEDRWPGGGPLAGLLSAWETAPEAAWLVVACDLAQLDQATLGDLVAARRAGAIATAFAHPDDGVLEPLCAIYEPAARPLLAERCDAGAGDPSLRRFLESRLPADRRLKPRRPQALKNFNRPEDFAPPQKGTMLPRPAGRKGG